MAPTSFTSSSHDLYWSIIAAVGEHFQFIAKNAEVLTLVLALACTLLISWLSFRFYERPFLKLKERWTLRTPRTVA